jgi:hypothetical protein
MILMQQALLRKTMKITSHLEMMSLWLKNFLKSATVAVGGKMVSTSRYLP